MTRIYWLFLTNIIVLSCTESTIKYPVILNDKQQVEEFGITYTNQYSNLEEIDDPTVNNWFKQQDSLTENYFQTPDYEELQSHYAELENRESDPASMLKFDETGNTYYLDARTDEDSEYLYLQKDEGPDSQIFNTRNYKDGGYEINYYKPSYNGEYIAVAMGKSELFFDEIIILDVTSKELLDISIPNAKPNKAGSIVWSTDNKCILYILYPNSGESENDRNSYTAQFCIDKIGTEPQPIYKDGLYGTELNSEFYPVPRIRSMKSNYIFIYEGNAADYWDCYFLPIEDFKRGNFTWKHLFGPENNVLYSNGMEMNHHYFFKRIFKGNTELCYTDLRNPDFKNPEIIDRGDGDHQIADFRVTKHSIFYGISSNGISERLFAYDLNTKEKREIQLPFTPGDIEFDFRSPYRDDLWITLSGWTSNPKQYYLESDGSLSFMKLGMWPDYPEFSNIIVEEVEVPSYNGTKIPLSIIRRKDHIFDGSAKGIVTAYGAYGLAESPWFHPPIADFVNHGNIYATAHVRGGGEKGPQWHEAGKMKNKPNSWKDLIACSEYLMEKGLVHENKLALNVNSAGAITGGMAVNERPDLFRVFTGFVPNLNLLRTPYIDELDDSDILYEFGSTKDKESFQNLLRMDPVINFKKTKKYPSTLMILGFNDYLISPSAPGKYIALLQEHTKSKDRLYLLDVKYDSEHEIDWLEDYSRMLYFTMEHLDK
jgi:prolyl oligopeptidase